MNTDYLVQYILEDEDLLNLNILIRLIKNKGLPYTFKDLSDDFKISQPTARKKIEELNDLLAEEKYGEVSANKNLLSLETNDTFLLSEFVSKLLTRSIRFKILEDIFWSEWTTVENFAIKNGVSRQTVHLRLTNIHELLKKFELTLNLSKKDPIVGPEVQIRAFYFSLFTNVNYNYFLPRDAEVLDFIHELTDKTKLRDLFSIYRFYYYLVIAKERVNNGYVVSVDVEKITSRLKFFSQGEFSYKRFYKLYQKAEVLKKFDDEETLNEAAFSFLVFASIEGAEFDRSTKINLASSQVDPDTVKILLELEKKLPFNFTSNEMNFFLMNINIFHTLSQIAIVDPTYIGGNNMWRIQRNLFPKENALQEKILNELKAEIPALARAMNRYPNMRTVYLSALEMIFNNHREPIHIWAQIRSSAIQKRYYEQIQHAMPQVKLVTYSMRSDLRPDNINGIITDWIVPEFYPDYPIFIFSSVNLMENFGRMRIFLCNLADMNFKKQEAEKKEME